MFGIVALVGAFLFNAAAVARFLPNLAAVAGKAVIAAGLIAALGGVAYWQAVGDSRWAVGGALLAVAVAIGALGKGNGARIGALAVGDLGIALFVIAAVTGYRGQMIF